MSRARRFMGDRPVGDGTTEPPPPALGVVLLAALAVLGGLLAFAVGILGAVLVGFADAELLLLGIGLVAVGFLFVVAGVGLWRLDARAWWLTLALCAFSLAAIAVGLYAWTSGVIPTAVLVALFALKDEYGIGLARGGAARGRDRRA